MHSYPIVLGLVAGASALAMPGVTQSADLSQATAAVVPHAPHTADHAPAFNPDANPEPAQPAIDQFCIDFTSDDPNWSWSNQLPWGQNSGTFGSLGGRMCVPTSDSAGGAMFIGPNANPGPGNTKLECYFPTSGQANCDVSLVDGYSLSVTCNSPGAPTIGGDVDLWSQGNNCDDKVGGGICKNDLGYSPAESDVSPFFQPAINNGNQYCIWVNCGQDYYFDVTSSLSCHISGTNAS